jgi:hypothetical protein
MRVGIIGSGPGGSVVANNLISAGIEVVVFEKGEFYSQNEIRAYSKEEMLCKYNGAGITASFGSPRIKYAEGACVGGGSEVNAGLYHEIPDHLIEYWASNFSIKDFNKELLSTHYEVTRNAINVRYSEVPPSELSLKMKSGADALGWNCIEVPRWYVHQASGGIRQSMTETYLKINNGSKLFTLHKNTKITGIRRLMGRGWSLISDSGVEFCFDAIFLAAGAIETARLLKKNRLSNNAGRSIFMHPSIKIAAKFNEKVNTGFAQIGVHQVKEFSPLYSFGCSISTREFIALVLNENQCNAREVILEWEKFGIYYAMINGGVGKVLSLPFVDEACVSYSLNDDEIDLIKKALLKLSELMFAAGALELYPSITGVGKVTTINQLEEVLRSVSKRQLNLMTIHLMGSCPFGENKDLTVADSWGRVHDQTGLYVADSSLMCSGLGVNPQGTVMAMASRVSKKFIEDFKCTNT